MPENATKGNSSMLRFLYGSDYEHNLGEGCISFTKECEKRNLYLGLSSLLIGTNLVMTFTLFDWKSVLYMFTDWAMMLTSLSLILVLCYSQKRDINSCKGTLAFIHIIIEFSVAFNVVVVIIYWSLLHF